MNSTIIFTSKGEGFDDLVFSLATLPPLCIFYGDPLSQIRLRNLIGLCLNYSVKCGALPYILQKIRYTIVI